MTSKWDFGDSEVIPSYSKAPMASHSSKIQDICSGVAELQAALEAALKSKHDLETELNSIKNPEPPQGCPFLDKLPVEVRNQIYELLLVCSLLSEQECVNPWEEFGKLTKYELTPGLLRACWKIHDEASAILYGKNTFVIACLGQHSEFAYDITPSPLARYQHTVSTPPPCLTDMPAFHKVQHWKLLVSAFVEERCPNPNIIRFCRSLCEGKVPIKSLNVSMLCRSSIQNWKCPEGSPIRPTVSVAWGSNVVASSGWGGKWYTIDRAHDLEKVLKPLRLLRNLKQLSFEHITSDAPSIANTSGWGVTILSVPKLGIDLASELSTLIQGSSPVDYVFKMYNCLVTYAQQFERSEYYSIEMTSNKWPRDFTNYHRMTNKICPAVNLFKTQAGHPVEDGLRYAEIAADQNNLEEFKKHRSQVLDYLQPQYDRIFEASLWMAEFSTGNSKHARLFNTTKRSWSEKEKLEAAKTILLLESHAQGFSRDIPEYLQPWMRLNRTRFSREYKYLPREIALAKLNWDLEYDDWCEIPRGFWEVISDMEKQYDNINRASNSLFDWDNDKDNVIGWGSWGIDQNEWHKNAPSDEKNDNDSWAFGASQDSGWGAISSSW